MTPTLIGCLLLLTLIVVYFFIRIIIVLRAIYKETEYVEPGNNIKFMIILGSGGHTGEMIKIVSFFDFQRYFPRTYIIASTDTFSASKVEQLESDKNNQDEKGNFNINYIPRSREVGQSWITTAVYTFYAFLKSLIVVFKVKPDLILCNGPGSCVPVCIAGLLFRIIGICNPRLMFVESLCRVSSLSLSGKMLYYFCDDFFIQWDHLCKKYPRAKYYGRLV